MSAFRRHQGHHGLSTHLHVRVHKTLYHKNHKKNTLTQKPQELIQILHVTLKPVFSEKKSLKRMTNRRSTTVGWYSKLCKNTNRETAEKQRVTSAHYPCA